MSFPQSLGHRRPYTRAFASALSLRIALLLLLGAAAFGVQPASAQTAPYPSLQIHTFVGFPPGGGVDIVARLVADKLQPLVGKPVVVENRAGASGSLATRQVADDQDVLREYDAVVAERAQLAGKGARTAADNQRIAQLDTQIQVLQQRMQMREQAGHLENRPLTQDDMREIMLKRAVITGTTLRHHLGLERPALPAQTGSTEPQE